MTSNFDVANSAHQIQMTTICHWMKPPWKFSAYATAFNVVPLPLTCQSRINLTQTNNFTVKSVKGMFCFDLLIACRCNCCLKNICNSTCWQLNHTAVTLSRLLKKNKLNATSHTWELIKLYALVTNGLCVVFYENREHNVLKLGIAVVQFFSCCWRTGTKLMLIPVPQGRSQIFSFGVATGGASFATRGAVNGVCRTFRKRPEKFWGATGGARQNFGGAVPPP